MKRFALVSALVLSICSPAFADDALTAAINGPQRTPENAARDAYRHPYDTLQFFGIRPDMKVVELAPGGGWYTEPDGNHSPSCRHEWISNIVTRK